MVEQTMALTMRSSKPVVMNVSGLMSTNGTSSGRPMCQYPIPSPRPRHILTGLNVHGLAQQRNEQSDHLLLVPLILSGAARADLASNARLPYSWVDFEIGLAIVSQPPRQREAAEEQIVGDDLQRLLSQWLANVRVQVGLLVLLAWVQAIHKLTRLIPPLVPEVGRASILPKEAIMPFFEVLCFVDEGHDPGQDAHAIEDLRVGPALVISVDMLLLQRLQTADEGIEKCFEVLVRLDLRVRRRAVVVVTLGETSYVIHRPQRRDIVVGLWKLEELRSRQQPCSNTMC